MSSRRIEVKRIATSDPTTFLDVYVSYDEGQRYEGGRARGFYLGVGVIKDENDGFIKYIIGNGGRGLLEPATRFNQRRLNELADLARGDDNEPLNMIVERVLMRSGLTRAEEPAAVCA